MTIVVEPILEDHKPVLGRLMELYNHDFSEFTGEDVTEHGYFGYAHLDHYWTEEGRYPFFVRVDGKLAGFVLVCSHCCLIEGDNAHSIAEFFVMRKYRRRHVGSWVAARVFDLFPGQWEVRVLNANKPAQTFWREAISGYTHGDYVLHAEPDEDWDGFGYTFRAPCR